MLFSASIFFSLSSLAIAAPLRINRRQDAAADPNLVVLKFADVLEQLETNFYSQALAKFTDRDFKTAGFITSQIPIQHFKAIQKDESTHSSVLQSAIKAAGGTPLTTCQFDFSSALGDVKSMVTTARLIENVGVGAYLGAAPLITDPVLLVAAGSILTVESRHQSILNILNGATAIPSSFDIALTPSEVLALAGGFISGCDVGVKANPALAITNTDKFAAGTLLKFQIDTIGSSTDGLFCQMMQGGFPFSISQPLGNCVVPEGLTGPVVIWITSDAQPLLNNVRDRATTQLVAGPTMTFIDSQQETLGQLVRAQDPADGKGTESGVLATSTLTISPAEASAILSKASSSASLSASSSAAKQTESSKSVSSTKTAKASSTSSGEVASKTASATSSVSLASPTDGSGDSSPSDESDDSKPTDDATPTDGSDDSSTPTDDSTDGSPTDDSDDSKPTDDSDDSKPTDDSDDSKPTDDSDNSTPTDDSDDSKPTDESDESKPTDDSDDSKPTDGSDDSKPTDDSDDSKPTDDSEDSKPTDGSTPSTTGSSDSGAGAGAPTQDTTQSIAFAKRIARRSSIFNREYD